ncbi:hypothetical protein C1701_16470 [Actinoalloteichus sp. AHMU CJ021]|uniref:Subtilisin inhibitor-like n=2 Tax=Actinoalloteichus cyanogriseus TaxID=2893586 RepID=A0ABT1JMN8_ACTCY|nr:SSI family serine proteinase inhibitor [Actinoalloteichus caeruleus]AUS79681.1 hypothetical protein C1701_16470 [Actinoalloteichus sp. AHMU CJ021]MCP2333777.1 Subtilisin inhibitor-like [Actinoalloteichus caeruleus DSM 43889]
MALHHLVVSSLLAGSALLGGAAPAAGSEPAASRPASTVLTLNVRPVTPAKADESPLGRTVLLTCDPDGGDHPNAEAACAELRDSGGDLEAIRGDGNALCTMIYQPVAVSARGTVAGVPVDYETEWSNSCTMAAGTGALFQF